MCALPTETSLGEGFQVSTWDPSTTAPVQVSIPGPAVLGRGTGVSRRALWVMSMGGQGQEKGCHGCSQWDLQAASVQALSPAGKEHSGLC